MKLKFKLPSWLGLALIAVLAAGLTGCATSTEYTYKYTDAEGKEITKTYTENRQEFLSQDDFYSFSEATGTVLAPLPLGATVTFSGEVKTRNPVGQFSLIVLAGLGAEALCRENGTPLKSTKDPSYSLADCPAYYSYYATAVDELNKPSYSTTCPSSCNDPRQSPALVMGKYRVSCQCVSPTPPSCGDSAALSARNADGTPVWDTCTPVELPPTTVQAPANDPLLKLMMGDGSCKRVYSLLLHRYVC
ncbi:hypothetical protein [Rhodoferax saidenbachensis]|uniref:hypothetical protein n=1 Tax=Rhodoferax saidenbachensis TaxID=1484693 RepID=UPI001268E230|nr:hypothetical protein [Rhodoferax saidenbachensis]